MVKMKFVTAVIIMMVLTNHILAGISVVQNGSFEHDGEIAALSPENMPYRWYDVELPEGFSGMIKM